MKEWIKLEVSEWVVRGIIVFSGILEIVTAFYLVANSHNVILESALILSGFLLIVGAVGFESWTPDKE